MCFRIFIEHWSKLLKSCQNIMKTNFKVKLLIQHYYKVHLKKCT